MSGIILEHIGLFTLSLIIHCIVCLSVVVILIERRVNPNLLSLFIVFCPFVNMVYMFYRIKDLISFFIVNKGWFNETFKKL